jgi:hypothetical protein
VVCAGATLGALGLVCASATPAGAIKSANATAAKFLITAISPQRTIGRLWNANGRSTQYSALLGQSRSAYHASKSAGSSTGSISKAQHSA